MEFLVPLGLNLVEDILLLLSETLLPAFIQLGTSSPLVLHALKSYLVLGFFPKHPEHAFDFVVVLDPELAPLLGREVGLALKLLLVVIMGLDLHLLEPAPHLVHHDVEHALLLGGVLIGEVGGRASGILCEGGGHREVVKDAICSLNGSGVGGMQRGTSGSTPGNSDGALAAIARSLALAGSQGAVQLGLGEGVVGIFVTCYASRNEACLEAALRSPAPRSSSLLSTHSNQLSAHLPSHSRPGGGWWLVGGSCLPTPHTYHRIGTARLAPHCGVEGCPLYLISASSVQTVFKSPRAFKSLHKSIPNSKLNMW